MDSTTTSTSTTSTPTTTTSTTTTTTTTNKDKNRNLHILIHISCICFITVNAVLALLRAHAQGRLSSVIGGVIFMYLISVSIICCTVALSGMPINEESRKKDFLIIMFLVLSTVLVFGVIMHISGLIGTIATTIVLVIMSAFFGFAFFLIISRGSCCCKESNKSLAIPGLEKAGDDHKIIKASDEPNSPLEIV